MLEYVLQQKLDVLFLRCYMYSWIGLVLQSGHMLAFSLSLSDFKTNTSFGFPVKKSGVVFLHFFEKSENELVQQK